MEHTGENGAQLSVSRGMKAYGDLAAINFAAILERAKQEMKNNGTIEGLRTSHVTHHSTPPLPFLPDDCGTPQHLSINNM